MKYIRLPLLIMIAYFWGGCTNVCNEENTSCSEPYYILHPIGKIVKEKNKTLIVLENKYQSALLGLDQFSQVTVIYWFDRNDTPEKRSILQVHPRGDKRNPIRGVFATHSPVRPNLIAISRCEILSVRDNIVEIDDIDAFPNSPVLDLKN